MKRRNDELLNFNEEQVDELYVAEKKIGELEIGIIEKEEEIKEQRLQLEDFQIKISLLEEILNLELPPKEDLKVEELPQAPCPPPVMSMSATGEPFDCTTLKEQRRKLRHVVGETRTTKKRDSLAQILETAIMRHRVSLNEEEEEEEGECWEEEEE